ncbi:MAG TPA: Xaa-Pro peptidase family protein [Gaiellaceae bacterium]|nr:Xaa-Pro peptidase family protein [Gaiellaceae bacterium]
MNGRVDRLRDALEEPLLVSAPPNVRYLTGFVSSNAAVLVEPDRVRLFTDFRYGEAARSVEGVELELLKRNLYGSLSEMLSGRIGFEASALTYASWETLTAGGAELVPRRGLVEALRAVKDESELRAIRAAAGIANRMYERLAEEQFVGRSERELAWRIEVLFHELGAEAVSFPAVVAGGPNGAKPHADPGDAPIGPGQTVVVDAGCTVDGYCSDCTRTFATGPLPDELARAYEVCLSAQEEAVAAVRAGASGEDVDAVARGRIDGEGFGEAFGHGLGHGVGLLVHEAPRLAQESGDVLASGNVVTVEPGIYLSGLGGIRIEDLVVVGDDGSEVLTSFPKELTTVH